MCEFILTNIVVPIFVGLVLILIEKWINSNNEK